VTRVVGLLGPKHVMEAGSYVERLEADGVDAHDPSEADQAEGYRVIYDELRVNDIRDESRFHRMHGTAETILSLVY
jgi:aspartate/glutamate racemase